MGLALKLPKKELVATRYALCLLKDLSFSFGRHYIVFIAATIAFGLVTLLPAWLFRYFTVSLSAIDDFSLLRISVLGLSIGCVLFLAALGSTLYQEWFRLRLESILRRRVISQLHGFSLNAFDGAQRGDWLMRMSGDLSRVEAFFGETIPSQVRSLGILLGAGALFFVSSGNWAFVALVAAILIGITNFLVQKKLAPVLSELRTLHGGVFQMLIESYEAIRTICTHRAEKYVERRLEKMLRQITNKSLKVVRSLGALIGGTEFSSQLMIVICLVGAGYALKNGQLTTEQALVYPFFLGLFYSSAASLASHTYDWNRYFIEGGRLAELLYGGENTRSFPSTSDIVNKNATKIAVTDAQIGYSSKVLFDHLDLEVNVGELCVLMGPSGCGKSTLLEMFAGLRPALSGKVEVRYKDTQCICTSIYDRLVPVGVCAYVEQAPYIFEGTLRENLLFGNETASDATVWELLKRIGLDAFAKANGGLDYFLQDRGRNISQGERYRIALGRALLLGRPFLLIDEPFSALDELSADIVTQAIKSEKEKAGIILVTHLIPEALDADEMWLFAKGAVKRNRVAKKPVRSEPPPLNRPFYNGERVLET